VLEHIVSNEFNFQKVNTLQVTYSYKKESLIHLLEYAQMQSEIINPTTTLSLVNDMLLVKNTIKKVLYHDLSSNDIFFDNYYFPYQWEYTFKFQANDNIYYLTTGQLGKFVLLDKDNNVIAISENNDMSGLVNLLMSINRVKLLEKAIGTKCTNKIENNNLETIHMLIKDCVVVIRKFRKETTFGITFFDSNYGIKDFDVPSFKSVINLIQTYH
jgi:hypothetical protein